MLQYWHLFVYPIVFCLISLQSHYSNWKFKFKQKSVNETEEERKIKKRRTNQNSNRKMDSLSIFRICKNVCDRVDRISIRLCYLPTWVHWTAHFTLHTAHIYTVHKHEIRLHYIILKTMTNNVVVVILVIQYSVSNCIF